MQFWTLFYPQLCAQGFIHLRMHTFSLDRGAADFLVQSDTRGAGWGKGKPPQDDMPCCCSVIESCTPAIYPHSFSCF